MIAVKLKKLWKPAEILQKCSFCFNQSQQRSEHAFKPQTKLWLFFVVWISYPWLTFSLQHNNIPEIFLVFTVFRVLQ